MSRCKACDQILGEYELKRIDKYTGHHVDLCNTCFSHSNDALNELGDDLRHVSATLSTKELDELVSTVYNT